MLVLSRKSGERIRIGDNVWVEIRRVTGNRVTLSIDAPRDVHILRGELEPFASEFEEAPAPMEDGPADEYRVDHYRVQEGKSRNRRPAEAVHA